ncbi:hypothetical protein XENOCAPTIV_021174 [Xenoophorus captivus]|uniref:Uncharacterized protein n=1 Tax=Xenoophorus captivus TaxID=1517983 RepID=A0ABV0S0L7_9TELE
MHSPWSRALSIKIMFQNTFRFVGPLVVDSIITLSNVHLKLSSHLCVHPTVNASQIKPVPSSSWISPVNPEEPFIHLLVPINCSDFALVSVITAYKRLVLPFVQRQ